MWQAFIFPQGLGLIKYGMATDTIGSEPIVGKVRHSRKETRIEARRMFRDFMRTIGEAPIDLTVEDVDTIRPHQIIELFARGYEHVGTMGMRWQPEE